MSELISVIVPVYKVEEYLPKCIESIINQTYKNLEILLINDGSPDNCGFMCEEYAKQDDRIRVINKTNGGLSDARNKGIEECTGEYILFVDSDDIIDLTSIEVLLKKVKLYNLDILSGNGYRIKGTQKKEMTSIEIPSKKVFTGKEYMYYRISKGNFQASAWINLYKTSVIKNNNIYFKKGLIHEDEHWTPRIMLEAKRVMYIDFKFYFYTIREGSITHRVNKEKNIKDIIFLCNDLEGIYKKASMTKIYKKEFRDYLSRLYMATAVQMEYNKSFYDHLIDKKFILRNTYKISTALKAFLYLLNIKWYVVFKSYNK